MRANIYVSATYQDLVPYRKAVCDAIRALGHVDVAMEHYVAEPKRPLVRCLSDVRGCDLYVGIFAHRYGYVPPGSALSITEQEFRAALKHRKDVLCFLLADGADWPDKFVDTGEAAARLAALRKEISQKYLTGFFSTPDDLATRTSQSIVKSLQLGETPVDADRENRLMREWRHGSSRADRSRARQALINMGSPRYAATIKDLLLEAQARRLPSGGDHHEFSTDEIASYMEELLALSVNSRAAMPVLRDLLHSEADDVRYFAVFNIGELGLRGKEIAPEVIYRLFELEQDLSPGVRGQLAHTLGKIHHLEEVLPSVLDCLRRLLCDTDDHVRRRASEALDQLST